MANKQVGYEGLMRATMVAYMADWTARLFGTSYKEELEHLKSLSDEDYSTLIGKVADALAEMPCPECGCESNGRHNGSE